MPSVNSPCLPKCESIKREREREIEIERRGEEREEDVFVHVTEPPD